MKLKTLTFSWLGMMLLCFSLTAQEASQSKAEAAAEAEYLAYIDSLGWQTQGAGSLGEWAKIELPANFRFLDGEKTDELMQAFGNLPDEYEGMIAVRDVSWFVLFQFLESGYVKDDDKDSLNPDKLLKEIQSGDKPGNEYREEMGLEPLYTIGWAIPPKYNEVTNNLEWAILLRSESGEESVNYKTKLLGRNGIMDVTLVCDPSILSSVINTYQNMLGGFSYNTGKSYAEFQEGDQIAEYGLAALITGGALYGAAKMGLLAKFVLFFKKGFKAIIVAVVAIGVAIKKFFTNLGPGKGMDRSQQE